MEHNPYILLIEEKRWADQGLLEVLVRSIDELSESVKGLTPSRDSVTDYLEAAA